MGVHLPSSSGKRLTWCRGWCDTTTNAMPLSGDICLKNVSSASKPPADAPIPTMGKRSDADCVRGTAGLARVRAAGDRVADRRARPCVATRFSVAWDFDGFCLATMGSQLLPGKCYYIVPFQGSKASGMVETESQQSNRFSIAMGSPTLPLPAVEGLLNHRRKGYLI